MTIFYRSMYIDGDTLPRLGDTNYVLGARRNVDIKIDRGGRVSCGKGGMSVTSHFLTLPYHLNPATGGMNANMRLFEIIDERLTRYMLGCRWTSKKHYEVHPCEDCYFDDYQKNLHATREQWSLTPNEQITP